MCRDVSLGVIFYQHLLIGIFFTASAMDEKSAIFLDSLDVPFIKIGSGDVNNLRLLKRGKEKFSEYCYDSTNHLEIIRKLFC